MPESHTGLSNIAIQAVYSAGSIVQQAVQKIKHMSSGIAAAAIAIAQQAEIAMHHAITKAYPSHSVIGEYQQLTSRDADITWYICGIDGMLNFIHGYPDYAICICVKQQLKPIFCTIFNPNTYNVYSAELGKGARLNSSRMRVATTASLVNSLLACDFESANTIDNSQIIHKITSVAAVPRQSGSTLIQLAQVAAGVLDGYIGVNLKPIALIFAELLLKESGGIIASVTQPTLTSSASQNSPVYLLAAAPKILTQLQSLLFTE
jgi:myo-inositol-1(or 4)-monophosphatase